MRQIKPSLRQNPGNARCRILGSGRLAMIGRLILGLALLVPLSCQAQAPARSAAGGPVAAWTNVPAVVVIGGNANDARLPLVLDAVAFGTALSPARLCLPPGAGNPSSRGGPGRGVARTEGPSLESDGPDAVPAGEHTRRPGRSYRRAVGRRFHFVCHALVEPRQGPGGDQERPALAAEPAQRRPQLDCSRDRACNRPWSQQRCHGIDVRPTGFVPARCVRVSDRALFSTDPT